tara:strand:- start:353 stop:817 length:465 start_codon:yes stop_codon:yes gene_type:complete
MKDLTEFLNENINEGKMDTLTNDLVKQYRKEVKTNEYDYAMSATMSSKMWTKMDGSKYKEPGKFKVRINNQDDREAVEKKRQVQSNFWPWLLKQSGVKSIGKVSTEFRNAGYDDAVEYKGTVFIKRKETDKHTITEYFSKGRFKNSGMWKLSNV